MSLRKSVNKMCKDCIYDPKPGNGTWLLQVQNCTSHDCALYGVRPITREGQLERNRKLVSESRDTGRFKRKVDEPSTERT